MDERAISNKLIHGRMSILKEYPFFGHLLFKLKFGLAECGTAFTDMRRIVFDPKFATRISEKELEYVLMHEVLHCALKHCTRGVGKQMYIYNVACDIVVNSIMLYMYHKSEITIDGEEIMHLSPDGKEGREYTAEQVYAMLMKMSPQEFGNMYCGGGFDNHAVWETLEGSTLEDLWNHHLKKTISTFGIGSGIPDYLERYLKNINHSSNTNWRQILHDFIQFNNSDYDFSQPDKRYSSDIILPSFCENVNGGKVEKLWFLVDTSGSVSDEAISVVYAEIKAAVAQIGNLSGMLSFFDYIVSDGVQFDSLEDILATKPIGGGGTNFQVIFKKLKEYKEAGDLPNVMVIITDGYADFPEEEAALGVPVIWVIVDSNVIPPWGGYAYVSI